jgi:glycosyltransferase involved in cell wall biosynthesis
VVRSSPKATVGIPVLNGERWLEQTLGAVRAQRLDGEVELLVADSGSRDRSLEIAERHGARVLRIAPSEFTHGGARNLLVSEASAPHVALLTQDAVPAGARWLAELLAGFELAPDVALVFGPYEPRPEASASVRRELREFFASLAPGGEPRVDRLDGRPLPDHPGPLTFFTDANACVARAAWERVPFRAGARYAEDQLLARDMLAAGFAKVFQPRAAVVHSHEYPGLALFRRFFDEWRGLREVHGHVEAVGWRATPRRVVREVRADRALLRAEGARAAELRAGTREALRYHGLRALGSALGSRADRLPAAVCGWCSLEGRRTFEPQPSPAPRTTSL